MSTVSRDRIPPLQYSSSQSLLGLERVVPKRSPLFQDSSSASRASLNKPLPPTPCPRKPSSVYSLQVEDIIDLYADRGPKNERLPSGIFLPARDFDLTHSQNSSLGLTESRLRSGIFSQQESDVLAIKDWLQTIKSSIPKSTSDLGTNSSFLQTESSTDIDSYSASSISKMNKQRPREHRRSTSNRPISPSSPPSFHSVQYEVEVNYPETPISSRIVDVVDHSLVPNPLRSSRLVGSDNPNSHFSRTSSGPSAADIENLRLSIRNRLRKSFRSSVASTEKKENRRAMSVASAKYPNMNLPSPRLRERINSKASQRRASIQRGLSNAYDTLTNFSIKPKFRTPDSTLSNKQTRGPRSPAIPITPYQQMGPKAWESPPKPTKHKSATKLHVPFFTRQHSVKESEKWREALKKQIMVVGVADEPYDGHYI
ncbi:hypothetical protein MMC14_002398 [Varicellaria rhodocarpa]|nr:hypothetical protein [Varicellaria rhodocarpa]